MCFLNKCIHGLCFVFTMVSASICMSFTKEAPLWCSEADSGHLCSSVKTCGVWSQQPVQEADFAVEASTVLSSKGVVSIFTALVH